MSDTNENEDLEFARELLDEVDDEASAAATEAASPRDVAIEEIEETFDRVFASRPVRQVQAMWDDMYAAAPEKDRLAMEQAVLTIIDERGLDADEARHYFVLMLGVLSGAAQELEQSSGVPAHHGRKTQKRKHRY